MSVKWPSLSCGFPEFCLLLIKKSHSCHSGTFPGALFGVAADSRVCMSEYPTRCTELSAFTAAACAISQGGLPPPAPGTRRPSLPSQLPLVTLTDTALIACVRIVPAVTSHCVGLLLLLLSPAYWDLGLFCPLPQPLN